MYSEFVFYHLSTQVQKSTCHISTIYLLEYKVQVLLLLLSLSLHISLSMSSRTNMAAETGYQMSTSSVEHLLIVIIFGIFHIVTRDVHVPYNYDHRCVVYTAPHAAPLSSSVSPTAPPRGRDALMRWLIALLCFIEEKYDTLEQGTCTRPEENTKKNMQEQSEEQTKKNMQEQSEENTTKNMRRILKRTRKRSLRRTPTRALEAYGSAVLTCTDVRQPRFIQSKVSQSKYAE